MEGNLLKLLKSFETNDEIVLDSEYINNYLHNFSNIFNDIGTDNMYGNINYCIQSDYYYSITAYKDTLNRVLRKGKSKLYEKNLAIVYGDYNIISLSSLLKLKYYESPCSVDCVQGVSNFILNELTKEYFNKSLPEFIIQNLSDRYSVNGYNLIFERFRDYILSQKVFYLYKLPDKVKDKVRMYNISDFSIDSYNLGSTSIKFNIKDTNNKKIYLQSLGDYNFNKYFVAFSEDQLKYQFSFFKKLNLEKLKEEISKSQKTLDHFSKLKEKAEKKLSELEDNLFFEEERLNYIFDI